MDKQYTSIFDYEKFSFQAKIGAKHSISHDVYKNGKGAPIVLIQELPGIGVETLYLADHFVAKGFQVILPHLFGPLEKTKSLTNLVRVFCMRKEFNLFAANKSSPIVDWLKSLCQKVKADSGAKGVGVIGMCLTGNFALSLMAEESVLASVASQPSMPLGNKKALHLSAAEITAIKEKIDNTQAMMALRFAEDKFCTDKRFQSIEDTFNGDGRERVRLKTLPGKAHAVLTLDFVNQKGHPTHTALQEVTRYFSEQLL